MKMATVVSSGQICKASDVVCFLARAYEACLLASITPLLKLKAGSAGDLETV